MGQEKISSPAIVAAIRAAGLDEALRRSDFAVREKLAAELGVEPTAIDHDVFERAKTLAFTIRDEQRADQGRFSWLEGVPNEARAAAVRARLLDALPQHLRPDDIMVALDNGGFDLKEKLSPAESREFHLRIRDVNAAIFTEPCLDLARRIEALRDHPLHSLDRVGTEPLEKPCRRWPDHRLLASSTTWQSSPSSTGANDWFGPDKERSFKNQAVVGEFGPHLARALVETGRIVLGVVPPVAQKLQADPAFVTVAGRLTVHDDALTVLQEGVVSIVHALSALLGKKPDASSLDELLEGAARSGVVSTLAAAPFGVFGPMVAMGHAANDPLTFSRSGHAVVPESLARHIRAERATKELSSSDFGGRTTGETETLAGCPLGIRGPRVGADGKVELDEETGLKVLAEAFIGVLRRVLAEQHAAP